MNAKIKSEDITDIQYYLTTAANKTAKAEREPNNISSNVFLGQALEFIDSARKRIEAIRKELEP